MSWIDKVFGSEEPRSNVSKPETKKGEIVAKEMEAYYNGETTVEEIEQSFQKMPELQDVAAPKETALPKDLQPKGVLKPKGSTMPYTSKYFFDDEVKLTIILVENTKEVAKQKDKLNQIVNSLVVAGQVCVINYGKLVRESKIVQAKDFECSTLLYEEFVGDFTCLFDALIALEGVVEKSYKKVEEINFRRVRTKSIEIIGIGRCVDNCSITSSQAAIESFTRVLKHRDVVTKYFCLSEENFMQAATIGFHSIGAITRNYM